MDRCSAPLAGESESRLVPAVGQVPGPATRPAFDTRPAAPGVRLAGFTINPHFGEQIRNHRFEPEVNIQINAPAVESFREDRPMCRSSMHCPTAIPSLRPSAAGQPRAWTGISPSSTLWRYAGCARSSPARTSSWPTWRPMDEAGRHGELPQPFPHAHPPGDPVDRGAAAGHLPLTIDLTGHSGGGSLPVRLSRRRGDHSHAHRANFLPGQQLRLCG